MKTMAIFFSFLVIFMAGPASAISIYVGPAPDYYEEPDPYYYDEYYGAPVVVPYFYYDSYGYRHRGYYRDGYRDGRDRHHGGRHH